MRRRALLLCFFALASASGVAEAQSARPSPFPSLDLRGFDASPDPAAGIAHEPAASPGHLEMNGAAWLSYASSQVVLRQAGSGDVVSRPVEHSLTGDLTFNIGLFGRAALGLALPYAIYQSGQALDDAGRSVLGELRLPSQAMGDLALVGKFTLIPPTSGDHGGFALAVTERFTFPTGDEASFLGEGDVTSETRLLLEYSTRSIGLYANAGAKFRGSEERFACGAAPGSPAEEDPCLTRVGHELPFGLAFRLFPRGFGVDRAGRWVTFAEIYGQIPVSPIDPFSENRVAGVEVAVGARYALMRDFSVLAGVTTGVVSGLGVPPVRAVVSLGWAPRAHDADGDLLDDAVDQCRELAEDRDGFEDDDGCPEGDNDQDTVPDQADRCPSKKEDLDGHRDDDGCPDPDNDGDGIPDDVDACRDEAGVSDADVKQNGCPRRDPDGDGIPNDKDACPTQAEDKDRFQDEDGCPDPDNDGDGVLDGEDTCPNVPGVRSADAKQRGCPEVDADGDTFWGDEDKCPLQPEDWNGKDDGDGCPDDAKRKPLVTVKDDKGEPALVIAQAVKFTKEGEIEAASLPILRAIGAELMKHPALGTKPAWSVAVGVKPSAKGGQSEAMLRAFAVASELRKITRRDAIAETVGWAAVKDLPGAGAQGIGFLLFTGVSSGEGTGPGSKPPR
jgi:OOP family OmpA-OmpF porin